VTVTSRVPALIDYLVALFQGSALLGQATLPVTVYDGPPTTEADDKLKLYVGLSDPDNTGAEPAADSQQEWGAVGRLGRNETITVHCCAEAWAGTDDMKTVRLSATGIVAAVEQVMQADTTQFGGNVLFPDPGITSIALLQNNTTTGAIARVAFDLVFKSRIGG
jgi:hypothetical protein